MQNRNQLLYFVQFLATVLVVIVHVGTIIPNPVGHFILKSMICRLAVPFFVVNNAFFFRLNCQTSESRHSWFMRMVKLYAFMYIVYLPFGWQMVDDLLNGNFHVSMIPLIVVYSFIYSGSFYHLWYFPALLFSVVVMRKYIIRFGYRRMMMLTFLLFSIGALETYSGYISNPTLMKYLEIYFKFFFTTRNGVFLSPIFILSGFFLADNKEKLRGWRKFFVNGLFVSLIIGFIEGSIVYQTPGRDKNFMFFSIPLIFCLFGLLIPSRVKTWEFEKLKKYSQVIFLFHLVPIQIFNYSRLEITPILGVQRVFLGIFVPSICLFLYRILLKISAKNGRESGCTKKEKSVIIE